MKEDDIRFSLCTIPIINYKWISHLIYKNETRQVLGKRLVNSSEPGSG